MSQDLSTNKISFIIKNTDDAICIISSSGNLLFTNPAAEELFGISAENNMKIWKAIPYVSTNDDLLQIFIDAVSQKMNSHEGIVDYTNNDGNVFNLHVRMKHFEDELSVYLIVITNLTQLFKVKSAFSRYTSPDIAEYVLSTPDGQKRGGKQKNVSILMSDLRGFTALSTQMPSDDLIVMLNHYFEIMSAIIDKYHGTIIEFLGDGIFVVFGAPKDYSDHASLALKCAVEMENAMTQVNEWNKEMIYPELEMGIAINSGLVVVGNIGSEKKMKYGCMGETVNIAGRVESLTVGGQIYITEHTKKLIPEKLNISLESSFLPKGAKKELNIYEIAGIGDMNYENAMSKVIEWTDATDTEGISFFKLDGKVVVEKEYKGNFSKISKDKKYAILLTDTDLEDRQNIMISKNDNTSYAKIVKKESEGYRIRFTTKMG
ncbi:MAG: PAS domain-containing protein [Eubacterium sp.]|nr:PAS domain-containing protein [Eubacterium sp.]